MKIKEVLIGITYPYQLGPYMYGKVDLTELIIVEEGEDPEEIRIEASKRLIEKCKSTAAEIILSNMLQPEKPVTEKAKEVPDQQSSEPRRRKFQ